MQNINKVLHSTEFLELKSTQSPISGKDWVYAHRPNAKNVIVIVPIITNEYVLFLNTKRPPIISEGIGQQCIELPAGLIGDEYKNETIEDALKRELLEETGMLCYDFKIVAKNVASSSGLSSEVCTIAFAYINDDTLYKKPQTDNGIIIDRVKIPIDKIKIWLKEEQKKGSVLSAQTLAALFYLFC